MPMFRDWTWRILTDFSSISKLPPYLSHPLWHDSRMSEAQSPFDAIVHLALFGGGGLGQGRPPTEPRLHRRHRDWI
jgi:hypothetical protein